MESLLICEFVTEIKYVLTALSVFDHLDLKVSSRQFFIGAELIDGGSVYGFVPGCDSNLSIQLSGNDPIVCESTVERNRLISHLSGHNCMHRKGLVEFIPHIPIKSSVPLMDCWNIHSPVSSDPLF